MPSNQKLRLIDANVNRACEGLRVIEDICRFLLDDSERSEEIKKMRHFLRSVFPDNELTGSRDAENDVGKGVLKYGSESRSGIIDIEKANFKRVQEAIRAIEEFAKLEEFDVSAETIREIESCRYRAYTLEKEILSSVL